MSDLTKILIVVLAVVLLTGLALRVRGLQRETGSWQPSGGRVIVRCRDGHLFTTTWIPMVSFKAVRLGYVRWQYCPVGRHMTFVVPVRDDDLTDIQRRSAQRNDDGGIP